MSSQVHTDPDSVTEPQPPDIETTKFVLVTGGTLPGPLGGPYFVNFKPNFSGLVCRKVPAEVKEGVYPRMPQFRVLHDVWYGTVDQMVDKFRSALVNAFHALHQTEVKDGTPTDFQKEVWAAAAKYQAWADQRPVGKNGVQDCLALTDYHTHSYPTEVTGPLLKKFYDQRRAMEAKYGPTCPLVPWQEEMCEDLFLSQRFEKSPLELARIFTLYALWKARCPVDRDQLCDAFKAFHAKHEKAEHASPAVVCVPDLMATWWDAKTADEFGSDELLQQFRNRDDETRLLGVKISWHAERFNLINFDGSQKLYDYDPPPEPTQKDVLCGRTEGPGTDPRPRP